MTEKQSAPVVLIPDNIAMVLQQGGTAWQEGRFAEARMLMEQVLAMGREVNNLYAILSAKHMLANIAFNECEDERSRALHEECLAECRAMNYLAGVASSLGNIALVDVVEGKFDDARAKYEEAIAIYEAEGYTEVANGVRQTMEDLVMQRKPLTVPRKHGHTVG